MDEKPFFPNFVDPVPFDHKFNIPKAKPTTFVLPQPTQSIECNSIPVTPLRNTDGENVDQVVLNEGHGILLMAFFDDICPVSIFCKYPCLDAECSAKTHQLPTADFLEGQLAINPSSDVQKVYEFVQLFPTEKRCRYFPAFAKIYARKNQHQLLIDLIKNCQKSKKTLNCFENIVDALLLSGWSKYEAIKFLVDNHEDSKEARDVLVPIIGSSRSDVTKFMKYLNMVNSEN